MQHPSLEHRCWGRAVPERCPSGASAKTPRLTPDKLWVNIFSKKTHRCRRPPHPFFIPLMVQLSPKAPHKQIITSSGTKLHPSGKQLQKTSKTALLIILILLGPRHHCVGYFEQPGLWRPNRCLKSKRSCQRLPHGLTQGLASTNSWVCVDLLPAGRTTRSLEPMQMSGMAPEGASSLHSCHHHCYDSAFRPWPREEAPFYWAHSKMQKPGERDCSQIKS